MTGMQDTSRPPDNHARLSLASARSPSSTSVSSSTAQPTAASPQASVLLQTHSQLSTRFQSPHQHSMNKDERKEHLSRVDQSEIFGIRSSRSSPSLKRLLSQRFSDALLNPTVVHRPHLRSRPSLQSIKTDGDSVVPPPNQSLNAIDTTDPSTLGTSGKTSSPTGISTGKTSLFSDVSNKHTVDVKATMQQLSANAKNFSTGVDDMQSGSLTPIPESSTVVVPCMYPDCNLP